MRIRQLILPLWLMASFTAFSQVSYEDFEGGASDLTWVAANGTYNGIVANPDTTGINKSASCGSYTKSGAHAYSLFWVNGTAQPLDLSVYNQFKVQVYSTVVSKVLLKLEGSDGAIEKTKDITETGKWVEYTFDLSAASGKKGLDKIILFFDPGVDTSTNTYLFDNLVAVEPGVVYEDFEGGVADLTWEALNGTYNGVLPNATTANFVNNSEYCGSYTKSGMHSYSLFLTRLSQPIDLSTNNQFKLQVYASKPTAVLLKLEGGGAQAIEITKNIAVTDAWQEYTFDFSAAAERVGLNTIIIFFDPGSDTTTNTYLFDNLKAVPKGACAGVTANTDIIDDFECNRNATYWLNWDSLNVVDNPNPTPVNSSAKVGRFNDAPGPWNPLVIDYDNVLDLSTRHYVSLKLWAPKTGRILFKLEGGVSPQKEVFVDVTEINTWVEYGVNFSDQAGASHKRISFFFNAGNEADTGGTYYLDDISRKEVPVPPALEDFQDGPNEGADLAWFPANGDAVVNGVFTGPVANPKSNSDNNSPMVGQYTKGSSPFSTLSALLTGPLNLKTNPQLNLQVLATDTFQVTMQLVSTSQGNKERTRKIATANEWDNLGFDFTDFADITDFQQVNVLFNPGTASAETYYFDNLQQGKSTVDPCEGVAPVANQLDDFECQRNVAYTGGNDRLKAVNNPKLSVANASLKVGEYSDPLDEWSALVLNFVTPIDLSLYNQFNVQILAAAKVPLLFKLEGGSSPQREIWTEVKTAGDWNDYAIDFSAYAGENHTRLAIFFNGGVKPTEETKYYIDNLKWSRSAYTACISDYEESAFTVANWRYFANGSLENTVFAPAENPDKTGINTSNTVGVFKEATDGSIFAGMYADLEAPVALPNDNKKISMKLWMDHAAQVVFKLEKGRQAPTGTGDVFANYTTPSQWQEITWDFSAIVPDGGLYDRITMILDFENIPTEVKTYYFDDIAIAGQKCGSITGLRNVNIENLRVSPNPAFNELNIQNTSGIKHFVVHNALGQVVRSLNTSGQENVTFDLGTLQKGMYVLTGYNAQGSLVANAKFVKE